MKQEQLQRYKNDIVTFAQERFRIPETREPIRLLPFQVQILREIFRRDSQGKFPFLTIVLSQIKKSGKTTLSALVGLWIALVEEPYGEVYVIGNDFEQSSARAFKTICRAIRLDPLLRQSAVIKESKGEIFFPSTETIIRALPSDFTGEAGANPTLTIWDETWGFVSENSRRLFEELCPVATRRNSLRLITSYAGWEGESQLLWEIYQRGMKGRLVQEDPPVRIADDLFFLWDDKPRMPWQTEEYYAAQKRDLRPSAYLRLHCNQWTSSRDIFIDLSWWDGCTDEELRPLLPTKTVGLSVGVDAAVKRDSCAVAATYFDPVKRKVVLAKHAIWKPTPTEPLDLEKTVEAYLLDLARSYKILNVFYDPFQFIRSATTLKAQGLPMVEYPQTLSNLTAMGSNLFELIKHGNISVYQDEELRQNIGFCVAVESPRGWRIAKEKASHSIDVIVALAMSAFATVEGMKTPRIRVMPTILGARRKEI